MKLYVEVKESTKNNTKKKYLSLNVDFGYRVATISFDTGIISELTDMTVRQLNELPVGEIIIIGEN